MNKKLLLKVLFFIVLACDVYAIATNNKPLEMIFKPLLMPILASWYLLSVKKPSFWFLSALFFSFWGDVLLLFEEKYFVFGLASFLVAHLLYIKLTSTYLKKSISVADFIKATAPFLLFFSAIIYVIYNNLNEMLAPVLVYGLVIACFGATTLVNYTYDKTRENLLLLLGAIIFIVSDSIIALNVFYKLSMLNNILIIILYSIAQFLICTAVIKNEQV